MAGAQILRLGRKAEEAIDLALDKKRERTDLRVGAGDPANVFDRIEPDMGGHDGNKRLVRRA